jgi:bifunctional NMN adenylyltransferase/nudix hydrolase
VTQETTFDVAVLIGRFQPFHNGHAPLLAAALARAGHVFVVLGSAFQARNTRNPFTWEERAAMIAATLDAADAERVRFIPVRDHYDDRRWTATVVERVYAEAAKLADAPEIALAGFHKDASSDYLRQFPDWPPIPLARQGDIDATALRQTYFAAEHPGDAAEPLQRLAPPAVIRFLADWPEHLFSALRLDHQAIEAYREKWGNGPFVTVDAVVTAAAHVLLIRRGNRPGQGLLAVPGGFLEGRERVMRGAIRELREETGLAVPTPELEAALNASAVFDHPDRSQRGRILTHAHWFDLESVTPETLPEIHGADDAAEARWLPIDSLAARETEFFEDHFHILNHFLDLA